MKIISKLLIILILSLHCLIPVHADFSSEVELTSTNWILVDLNNDQVLSAHRADEQVYPASLTKLMTALIALESFEDLSQTITFTEEMLAGLKEANAAVVGYKVGDTVPVIDLIYGDLLASGADCSRGIAYALDGSETAFVMRMNQRAQQLGMTHTHYVNTSGLHDDAHVTTCNDLLILFKACMAYERFTEILSAQRYQTSATASEPEGYQYRNAVLQYINQEVPIYQNYVIPGYVMGKSGFTNEAAYTLASLCQFNGMKLVLINCGAYVQPHYPASIEDAANILNYYRGHYGRIRYINEQTALKQVEVRNGSSLTVSIGAVESVDMDLPTDGTLIESYEIETFLEAPIEANTSVGILRLYDGNTLLKEVSLITLRQVDRTALGVVRTFVLQHESVIIGMIVVLIGLIFVLCRRMR